jgi:hypothetical protein
MKDSLSSGESRYRALLIQVSSTSALSQSTRRVRRNSPTVAYPYRIDQLQASNLKEYAQNDNNARARAAVSATIRSMLSTN